MKRTLLALSITSAFAVPTMPAAFAETEVSGVIEVEATYNDDGTNDTSDIAVATVELGVDHKVNDKVDVHILFLYEDPEAGEDEKIVVDEASIAIHPNDTTDIVLGRQYAPFGSYESNMVSYPLPLEIGETNMDAALINKAFTENLSGSAYVYKGTGNKVDDGGISLDYGSDNFNAGIGYISDANETNRSAVGVYANGTVGRTTLMAEHVQLEKEAGAKPTATQLEVGFDLGNDKVIALTAQQTAEAQALGLSKKAYGIAYSMPIYQNTRFAAEYMKSEDYAGADNDAVTLQVAYEF